MNWLKDKLQKQKIYRFKFNFKLYLMQITLLLNEYLINSLSKIIFQYLDLDIDLDIDKHCPTSLYLFKVSKPVDGFSYLVMSRFRQHYEFYLWNIQTQAFIQNRFSLKTRRGDNIGHRCTISEDARYISFQMTHNSVCRVMDLVRGTIIEVESTTCSFVGSEFHTSYLKTSPYCLSEKGAWLDGIVEFLKDIPVIHNKSCKNETGTIASVYRYGALESVNDVENKCEIVLYNGQIFCNEQFVKDFRSFDKFQSPFQHPDCIIYRGRVGLGGPKYIIQYLELGS